MAFRSGSKAKEMRQTPSSALHLSSFMFACFDPFNASAWGGALQTWTDARQEFDFREDRILNRFKKNIEFVLKIVVKRNFPFHTHL